MANDWVRDSIGATSHDPTSKADWSARFQVFLAEAAGRAKRNRDLYQDLLERVAAGELTVGAFDSHLPAFLQANGVDYANDMAGLSMRFLSGLIETATGYSYELVDTIFPGSAERPDTDPPVFETSDWSDWFGRLTDYATRQGMAVTEMLRSVAERVADGEISPSAMREASTGFLEDELSGSAATTVALYFDLLTGLDEINSDFGAKYLEAVRLTADPGDGLVLELSGSPEGVGSVRLAVTNTHLDEATVRCVLTDLRRADGVGPAFRPDVSIVPERFELAPGEERIVALSLTFTEPRYEVGSVYVGTLHVLAPDETLLAVPVRARVVVGDPT